MNKETFLDQLRKKLSCLPQDDIEERILFYQEMIDDRMEEGMTEEEAVAAVGTTDEIVEQAVSEIPLSKFVLEKVKPRKKRKPWEIVLLVLGSPVWLPLVLAAAIVLLSVYIVIWSVVICVYAADVSLAAGAVFSIPSAIQYVAAGNPTGALFLIGMGLALAGLAILVFFASVRITREVLKLTKRFVLWIKTLFIEKEDSENV